MDQILQILIQNGYVDEAGAQDIAELAKSMTADGLEMA